MFMFNKKPISKSTKIEGSSSVLSKRLKIFAKNYQHKKNKNEKDNDNILDNIIIPINKKTLITSIIKEYYNNIKVSGYSSLISNKENNTVFQRRFNKKYSEPDQGNKIIVHSKKSGTELPVIQTKV